MKAVTEINRKVRTEVVELNVGSDLAGPYNFGQLPNLRQAKQIISIESYNVDQVSVSPKKKAVITAPVMAKAYLSLVELGDTNAEIHVFPLYDLNQNINSVIAEKLNCQPIDFEKSFITVAENTGLSADESFLFKIRYIKA